MNKMVLDNRKGKSMSGIRHLSVVLMILAVFFAAGVVRFVEVEPTYDAPYLSNPFSFSFELAGNEMAQPDIWPDQWFFNQEAPYKYRVLGKLPILATYKILEATTKTAEWPKVIALYWAFLFWTVIFLYTFLWYGSKLVQHLVEDYFAPFSVTRPKTLVMASTAALALLPPVLFAFKFPVHGSPNDFLSYTLIALALLSLRADRLVAFTLFVLLGVFCRETTLIVLAPLVFMTSIRWSRRIGVVVLIMGVFIAYRLLWPGSYNPMSAATHNSKNPWESLLFLFMVFAPFWLLGITGALAAWRQASAKNPFVQAIIRSFWPATLTVLAVVWFFARVREIRIEYILFFYYIPLGIWWVGHQIKTGLRGINAFTIFLIVLASLLVGVLVNIMFMPVDVNQHLRLLDHLQHFFGGFGGGWRHQLVAYTVVTVPIVVIWAIQLWKKHTHHASK